MSQRASFVTEYLYCEKCADAVEAVLCSERHKHLCAQRLRGWSEVVATLPIIAGKVGGLYMGEEYHIFDFNLRDEIQAAVCHPVTVVILGDSCEVDLRAYRFTPKPGGA